MKPPSLKTTFYRFGEYYIKLNKEGLLQAYPNYDLIEEALKRFTQLTILMDKIDELVKKSNRFWKNISNKKSPKGQPYYKTLNELELLTESFYYIAHRLIKILRKLPYFKGFECKAVSNVRNKLIEHADDETDPIVLNTFNPLGSKGPIIKWIRLERQKNIFIDRGLYYNASTFLNKLDQRLTKII